MPTSDTWCIAWVRIWISSGLPSRAITAVWRRLVQVVLGDGDVVVELARDRTPQGVDDAQRGVAVTEVVDEDADRVDVVDLAELGALALHLFQML